METFLVLSNAKFYAATCGISLLRDVLSQRWWWSLEGNGKKMTFRVSSLHTFRLSPHFSSTSSSGLRNIDKIPSFETLEASRKRILCVFFLASR
jgi:hypothetical protein